MGKALPILKRNISAAPAVCQNNRKPNALCGLAPGCVNPKIPASLLSGLAKLLASALSLQASRLLPSSTEGMPHMFLKIAGACAFQKSTGT